MTTTEKYIVCTRCGHSVLRKRRPSRCAECGHTGQLEISGPDALRGMFAAVDNIKAGRQV